MNELPKVVLVGQVAGLADGAQGRTCVLPEPLDFKYLQSKQPDMVVIYDRAMPGSAREYARLLRTRDIVPGAVLVAAYPNGHMPDARELRRAGIVLAVSEAEIQADLDGVFSRATKAAEIANLVQMPLLERSPKQAEIAFAVAADGGLASRRSGAATHGKLESSVFPSKEYEVKETASSLAAIPGQTPCPQCKRWRPAPNDKFCAWCGGRLIRLKCDPAVLCFRTDQKEAKGCILSLHNFGINTLFASVEVVAGPEIKKRFRILPEEKQGAVEVPGGAAESLTITFDNSGINPTFDYSAVLEIFTNVDEPATRIPLLVERPPIALLVFPPGPQKIVYGDPTTLRGSVRNSGGGVLQIEGIKLQQYGHPKLTVDGAIAAGQELPFEFDLDLEKLRAGDYVARGEVFFRNHPELPFVIEFTFAKPPRLRLVQERLHLDVYNIGRKQHRGIAFENIGAETLKIIVINAEAEGEWLSTLCRNKAIEPGAQGYLDVFVDATSLPLGTYSGELTIQSNGYDRDQRITVDLDVHEMQPLKEAIGIDFGTSVSCAAMVKNDVPVLIPLEAAEAGNDLDGRGLPSVVFFEENFFPLVGATAQERAVLNPAAAVRSVKRLLGRRRSIKIREQERSPEEVATEIFRALLAAVESSTLDRGSPVNALFTVPADISDEQIKSVLASAKKAGLVIEDAKTSEYVIDEPSAAAMYYLWKRREQGECAARELVFIYDFGAGTLDCSLVEITNDAGDLKIQVLATAGDPQLGGDDIDLVLAQNIARRLVKGSSPQSHPVLAREEDLLKLADKSWGVYKQALEIREKARAKAEQLKIKLTTQPEATMEFPDSAGNKVDVTVARAELDVLLTDLLRRSDQVVLGCCSIAGRKPEDVHTLLHTGRGSLIPKIRERVCQLLPSAADNSEMIEAKACVALGAAWWAHIKNMEGDGFIEVEGVGRVLPNTICYRKRVKGGVGVINVPVFNAGERFPLERTVDLSAGQKDIKWRLDICEKRFGSDAEIRPRGSVEIPPQADPQSYKATFSINRNRILEVSVGGKTLKIEPAEDDNMDGRGRR